MPKHARKPVVVLCSDSDSTDNVEGASSAPATAPQVDKKERKQQQAGFLHDLLLTWLSFVTHLGKHTVWA